MPPFNPNDAEKMRAKAADCRYRAQESPTSDASGALIALAEEYELEARELDQEIAACHALG